MNAIDTVIFDIGNVLADFDWEAYIRETLGDGERARRTHDAIRGRSHELWNEMDRGVMPEADIIDGFVRNDPEMEPEIRQICAHLGGCMRRRDDAIPWIQEVKAAGRRALYLSNYSRGIMRDNPGVLDFLPYLDGGIFSCNVQLIKPDPAIYLCLIDRYHLTPATCVFIDDFEPNVRAAQELGFHVIHLVNHEQAHADLAALLG